jgi:hypothetical protein
VLEGFVHILLSHARPHLHSFPRVRDLVAFCHLIPTFGAHRGLGPKITPIMPPRRQSQCLHPDEGLPKTSSQKQPILYPPTQTLSTIVEGSEHSTFGDIPELQLHQPATMSTTAADSSQNGGGARSTQTNGGDPHQSPPRASSPIHASQGDANPNRVQVQDWDKEEYEDEAVAEEEELIRVQQEIERLHQEQESIMRR